LQTVLNEGVLNVQIIKQLIAKGLSSVHLKCLLFLLWSAVFTSIMLKNISAVHKNMSDLQLKSALCSFPLLKWNLELDSTFLFYASS